jgi:hypothetical protein
LPVDGRSLVSTSFIFILTTLSLGYVISEGDVDEPPNVLRFSCRRGAAKTVKIATISRAEGGQLQAPVGRRPGFWLYNGIFLRFGRVAAL